MSKDNITIQSLITLAKTKASAITDSLTKGSLITDALVLQSPIGIESIAVAYSNGIVTNSIFGEIAVFDFDVVVKFSGDVVFTVDWGAEIGETEINATLVDGVPQSLDTSIEIPEGVDPSQTINVTDSLGGSYSVGYTIEAGFDSDAQAFIDAAVITDETQQNAINNLVKGLKADGIWDKFKAIYPIVGGTASQHKFNLKDPRDTDAAFRLTFSGGITHSATGMIGNGSTGFCNTHFIPSSELPDEKLHLSFYSRTDLATSLKLVMGGRGSAGTGSDSWIGLRGSAANSVFRINIGGGVSYTDSDSLGLYTVSRESAALMKAYKDGGVIGTDAGLSSFITDVDLYILAYNNNGTAGLFTSRQCAFSTIGGGLIDTEVADMYTRTQSLQTALSRQV